jgi:hypothetical protein
LVLNFTCVGYSQLVFFISEMKTAAPDVEFIRKECTAVMNFLFLKENKFISITLSEKSPSYLAVKNWVD